jgi:hypothetical protein
MPRPSSRGRAISPLAALLVVAACTLDSPTDPPQAVGHLVAVDSLTAVDGQALPYVDTSSDARSTVVAGMLRFYGPASYTDTVFTPGGAMSRACVQEVPNGASVGINGLVTRSDSSTYLLLPCSVGTYVIVLTRAFAAGGSARTEEDTLSQGSFSWTVDTLTLNDAQQPSRFKTSLAGAMVDVMAPDHAYVFEAVRVY